MNTSANPIDHAIVLALFAVEALCWVINELAGFHAAITEESEVEIEDPRDTIAIEAPVPAITTEGPLDRQNWEQVVLALTIRELRKLTNIKSSRYNKRDLQQYALDQLAPNSLSTT